MRFLAAALIAACSTANTQPTRRQHLGPSPQNAAAELPMPLHPSVRAASGGPVMLEGLVAHPGPVPYSPGITLATALRLVGGPTALANRVVLRRQQQTYVLALTELFDHSAPDPELAPGDVVTIDEVSD